RSHAAGDSGSQDHGAHTYSVRRRSAMRRSVADARARWVACRRRRAGVAAGISARAGSFRRRRRAERRRGARAWPGGCPSTFLRHARHRRPRFLGVVFRVASLPWMAEPQQPSPLAIDTIFHEIGALDYPRTHEIFARFPDAERIPIESYQDIPGLYEDAGNVESWMKIK